MDTDIQFSIDKEKIASLNPVVFPGKITVINSLTRAKKALKFLSSQRVVGFDTETRPNFRKGQHNKVALIQISTDKHAFLFRINKIGVFEAMKNFLENEEITKVGLSLRDDFQQLHTICEFEPKGFIDLQNVVKNYRIADTSLQKVYAIIFQERISKGQQLSNWEAELLTHEQLNYGAIDAWACLKIFSTLSSGEFDAEKCPYIKIPEPIENEENEEI